MSQTNGLLWLKKPWSLTIIFIIIFTSIFFTSMSCVTEIENEEIHSSEIPLIYHMGFMSRYAKKLHFAGQAENWKLAYLYSHEIEEVAEAIIDGNYVHHDLNMGDLIKVKLLPQVEKLEEAINNKDLELFSERYEILVQSCNSCHVASDYGIVKVMVPERHTFNQDFTVNE